MLDKTQNNGPQSLDVDIHALHGILKSLLSAVWNRSALKTFSYLTFFFFEHVCFELVL